MLGVLVVAGGILLFTIVSTRTETSQSDSAATGLFLSGLGNHTSADIETIQTRANPSTAAPKLVRQLRRKPVARQVRQPQQALTSSNLSLHPTR